MKLFYILPQLGIKNVLQGDFLYSASDVKTKKIDGQDYVTFHPNTIVYAVPVGSDMAKDILKSKIGIVWHTSYSGTTFESMKAKFGADVSKLSKSKDVWSQDAMLKDITQATLSAADTQIVNERLSAIGTLFNKISGNVLKELGSNPALSQQIETFNNSFVRDGEIVKDTKKHTEALVKYIYNKFQKEIDKRKTSKGKDAQASKRDEFLKFFSADNKKNLKLIFDLQKLIVEAKLILIAKLNELNDINTFVKTSKGYKVTGQEGYVAIDTLTGGALKVVDRMEFSFNNFSPRNNKRLAKSLMIKSFTRYLTEAASTVYFTFGRMNPPTVGHGILLDKITKLSGSDPYKIYLSHSVDSKKNPLEYKDKVKYARKMFPKQARSIIFDSSKKLNNRVFYI